VIGLGLGVYLVVPPIYVKRGFGLRAYGVIFGAISMATTLGSSLLLPVFTKIGANSGYGIPFYACIACAVLAAALYLTAGRMSKGYIERFDPDPA
jgi:cyanate permease